MSGGKVVSTFVSPAGATILLLGGGAGGVGPALAGEPGRGALAPLTEGGAVPNRSKNQLKKESVNRARVYAFAVARPARLSGRLGGLIDTPRVV
jgi:hypothetical protein